MNTRNANAIKNKIISGTAGDLQKEVLLFKSCVSKKYAAPAAKKKIMTLNKSEVTPNAPV